MISGFFRFIFSKAFWFNALIAATLLFFAGKKLLAYLDEFTLHGQTIVVPDFKKIKIEKLDAFISAQKMQYIIIDSIYLPAQPKGVVLEQDPPAGALVKEGRKIYLTVNAKMPLRVALPDLTDITLRQATAILEYYGLKLGNKKYVPDQCFNCVLRIEINGKKAEAGEMVDKNEIVDLVLGQGESKDLAQIPDLKDKTFAEVQSLLNTISLNLFAVTFENCKTTDDSASAKVFKQSPVFENAAINLGSTINVWFSCK